MPTPETNYAIEELMDQHGDAWHVPFRSFARTLERERDSARSELKQARAIIAQLTESVRQWREKEAHL